MAYIPTVWQDGDIITAARMNRLENGVRNAAASAGAQGPTGPQGERGPQGPAGQGVPAGGGSGQLLAKRSAADHDTYWIDAPAGGASGVAGVSGWNGRTGAVVPQAGDYTAAMVGAATIDEVNAAIQSAVLASWEASY